MLEYVPTVTYIPFVQIVSGLVTFQLPLLKHMALLPPVKK